MSRQRSVKFNLLMNTLLTMSSFIFPLVTFPYVSRILLPVGTGKVSFATSVISYFSILAQLGIPTYGIRACAKVRDDKDKLTRTVHEIFIINIITTLISYGLFFCVLFTVPKLVEDKALFVISSMTLFFNAIGMEWLYKALEQYTYITVRSIVFKLIALIGTFLLIKSQEDYVIYGGITIFAASASSILNFFNVRKYVNLKPIGNYNFRQHLKAILIFFAMACATTIYTHMDTVMIGFMKTDADVGYYNAAIKIKSILVSLVTSLGVVLLPRASYYIEKNLYDEFYKITQKAISFVMITAVPLMVYFILFAGEGILFLSGSAYEQSIVPMQVIMPTIVFIGLTNTLGVQMLVPLGKEKIVLYSEILGAIVDLIINLFLIPKLASTGAAIGTLIAEAVVFAVQCCALKKEVSQAFKQIRYLKIFVALVLASSAAIFVKFLELKSFLTLVISSVVFFGVYGGTLLISGESMVKELYVQFLNAIKNKAIK